MNMPAALAPLQARWRTLEPREQLLVSGAAVLVGLALVWWLLIAPPLRVLRLADAQQRSLDLQLQKMQDLQAQAQALQSQTRMSRSDSLRALEVSVKQRLGAGAQLNVIGDRATVTLRHVPADALAQWLVQARVNARAIPGEVRLVRSTGAAPGAPGSSAGNPNNFGARGANGTRPVLSAPSRPPIVDEGGEGSSEGMSGNPSVSAAPNAPAAPVVAWDGTLVMSLPPQ